MAEQSLTHPQEESTAITLTKRSPAERLRIAGELIDGLMFPQSLTRSEVVIRLSSIKFLIDGVIQDLES